MSSGSSLSTSLPAPFARRASSQTLQGVLEASIKAAIGALALAMVSKMPSAGDGVHAFFLVSKILTGQPNLSPRSVSVVFDQVKAQQPDLGTSLPLLAGALHRGALTSTQRDLTLCILNAWYLQPDA
jgi:hypothetical protein